MVGAVQSKEDCQTVSVLGNRMSPLRSSAYWLEQGEQLRQVARRTQDVTAKRTLLEMVAAYRCLAQRAAVSDEDQTKAWPTLKTPCPVDSWWQPREASAHQFPSTRPVL